MIFRLSEQKAKKRRGKTGGVGVRRQRSMSEGAVELSRLVDMEMMEAAAARERCVVHVAMTEVFSPFLIALFAFFKRPFVFSNCLLCLFFFSNLLLLLF